MFQQPQELICALLEKICYEQLEFPSAFERLRSDLEYIVVGAIIECVSHMALEKYLADKISTPLSLESTVFQNNMLCGSGVTSSAADIWKVAAAILSSYHEESGFIPRLIVDSFIGVKARYKLGWETDSNLPKTIYMISNTGCGVWINLENKFVVAILTNGGAPEQLGAWMSKTYVEISQPLLNAVQASD